MISNQCMECKHKEAGLRRCKAFPDKDIPFKIISGQITHDKPVKEQDNEIVFEKIENQ